MSVKHSLLNEKGIDYSAQFPQAVPADTIPEKGGFRWALPSPHANRIDYLVHFLAMKHSRSIIPSQLFQQPIQDCLSIAFSYSLHLRSTNRIPPLHNSDIFFQNPCTFPPEQLNILKIASLFPYPKHTPK